MKEKDKRRVALALTLTLTFCLAPPVLSKDSAKSSGTESAASSDRKRRVTSAESVELVKGNPQALFWKTEDKPRSILLCLHELGLHKGVFEDLGKRMAADGIAVYAIDLRGFGGWREKDKKDGRMDLEKTYQDVVGSLEAIKKLHPETPVFVLGEAMGGALCLQVAAEHPDLVRGVITAAPGGQHYKTVANYFSVGSKVLTGGRSKDSGMSEDLMAMATPKQELRTAFQDDEDVRLDLKPRELMACQFYMYKTKKFARQIKDLPVLVVHGKNDGESKAVGSEAVYDNLATEKKEYLLVDDGDHYTYEDTKVPAQAFKSALSWIDKHLPGTM
ncbi:MAG: alpha/beta fold hydrolase [Cyanobacteria bacterium HKST-UBA02]|nr:alpha/beta fold hydrolase [Cyanobacteria bacterium HKST-UBA02]